MPDREKVIEGLTDLKRYLPSTMWDSIIGAIYLLKEQEIKIYGKLYCISAEAVAKDRDKVEQELFIDIAKCLIENGVLVIHSENTIPGVQVTYGWKLKGRPVK